MPPCAAPEWLRTGWTLVTRATSAPASCAAMAARIPARPAPTTTTSWLSTFDDPQARRLPRHEAYRTAVPRPPVQPPLTPVPRARAAECPALSADAVITLVVIVVVLGVLISERVSPALTILGGAVVLLVAGVTDADEAFSGFSNSAPLTVAALYVVAGAAGRTRALEVLIGRLSSRTRRTRDPGRARGARARAHPHRVGLGVPQQHAHRRHGHPAGHGLVPPHRPLARALPDAGQLRRDRRRRRSP